MLQSIIIDQKNAASNFLAAEIQRHCPNLWLRETLESEEDYFRFLHDPETEIVFVNPSHISQQGYERLQQCRFQKAFICFSDTKDYACLSASWHSVGYLTLPLQSEKLRSVVESAMKFAFYIREQKRKEQLLQNILGSRKEKRMVGIPTIDGYEILSVDDILRCEGLQKYTRIVTRQKTNIISSYNIGAFKKLLDRFSCFFSPHRSHIINMGYINKFKKVGIIKMEDGSSVPIAKNRKEDFLSFFPHL